MDNVVDLENALLGLILVDEKVFYSVKGVVNYQNFYDRKNSIIFKAISEVYDKGFDDIELKPIINQLKKDNSLEKIGGIEYLSFLMERPALKSNLSKYIKEIVESSSLRNVKNKIKKLGKNLDKYNSAEDILNSIEQDIIETVQGTHLKEFINSKKAIKETIKKIEDRATGKYVSGIAVNFPSIDKITGGFQKGDLIILAARPSMGKTALALNMATNASFKNNIALFSLEMPIEQLFKRIISFTSYVDQNKLRDSKYLSKMEWDKIYSSKHKIEKMNLFIDDTAGIKLSELVWKARRLNKNNKLDMIVIDYMQLIVVSNSIKDNRQNEVSIISRTLKKLARDLNIPIIALSQLSRRVEQRESKIPIMSDLRESGSIEQDADIVSFIYRDNYYKKKDEDNVNDDKEVADIYIAKHRNGATKNIKLFFKPSYGLFIEEGI